MNKQLLERMQAPYTSSQLCGHGEATGVSGAVGEGGDGDLGERRGGVSGEGDQGIGGGGMR